MSQQLQYCELPSGGCGNFLTALWKIAVIQQKLNEEAAVLFNLQFLTHLIVTCVDPPQKPPCPAAVPH